MDIDELVANSTAADDRSLARLLSLVEDEADGYQNALSLLYRKGGAATTLGITGAPGAGKSTLVSQLVSRALDTHPDPARVGVIAVDPTSPFSGGAILGDRIRMGDHSGDPRVFMRSVANRGHLGGLAATTPAVIAALDGVGFTEVILETVGVGQAEVDVASACHTTIVVVPAGWGDAVQTAKAGFLEIADIYVVNKSDRPAAEQTAADLQTMLDIGPSTAWRPPVLATVASDGVGTAEVWDAVQRHREHLVQSGEKHDREARIARLALRGAIEAQIASVAQAAAETDIDRLVARTTDPWAVAASLVAGE